MDLSVGIAGRSFFGGVSQKEMERKFRHRRAAEEGGHGQGHRRGTDNGRRIQESGDAE